MKPKGSGKWIVCRICLQQPTSGMQHIFDNSDDMNLAQMIADCGGVPIKKLDEYPDMICSKCLKYLKVAHKFRVTCQRSYNHLGRFLTPMTGDEDEQPITVTEAETADNLPLKEEPRDVKEEFSDGEEIVNIFNILDGETKEYLCTDNPNEVAPEEAEYLDIDHQAFETEDDDDEEFVPCKKITRHYVKRKEKKPKKPVTKPKAPKQTSFICDVCGNIYPSQGRLNEHIKVHSGIKPYDCEICGHRFAQTQQLSRHMNTHTGKRPFKCNYCPAAFADLSTRNKHHRIHTNERPYVCDTCGKTFTYTNTLKVHKMIHTGEKPHVCHICGKGFPQAYKLRSHMHTHVKKSYPSESKLLLVPLDDPDEDRTVSIQMLEM